MSNQFKLVVTVPEPQADAVRAAMGEAGAGQVGNYEHCSFSSKGVGRFRPLERAHPTVGHIGTMEFVEEERIEATCSADVLDAVVSAIRAAHPYEEPVIDVYALTHDSDRVRAIEERNARVEADKAWETSWTRRALLMIFTYLAIAIYLVAIGIERPWINAIVPAVGFMLSTLTLPWFKKMWLHKRNSSANSSE